MTNERLLVVLAPFICMVIGELFRMLGINLVGGGGTETPEQTARVASTDFTYLTHYGFTASLSSSHWDRIFILAISGLGQWSLLGSPVMVGVSLLLLFAAVIIGVRISKWPPRHYLDSLLFGRWRSSRISMKLFLVTCFRLAILASAAVASGVALSTRSG